MQKTVVMMAFILLAGGGASAQEISLEDQQSTQVETVREQSAGSYNVMNMEYITSLGMQQKAWNNPMEHLGEGQSRPGYSRYLWKADTVLPIRLREGMMTLINFPSWELVENVWIGAKDAFYGEIPAPNALMLYPAAGVSGVDSNLVVFGRSGNRYAFYLRSETYNTDRITHSVVDVAANAPAKTQAGGVGGGGRIGGSGGAGGTKLPKDGDPDWMESVPTNPEAFRFDIDIFIPNPEDVDIAPERVWRDEIFTYIDFGDKSLGMNQRPVVNMILQESETPVGFRTKGKYGRLMIVEGVGDMVLRNGRKLICLKLRRDPVFGTTPEYNNQGVFDAMPNMVTTPVGGYGVGFSGGSTGLNPIPQQAFGGMGLTDVYASMNGAAKQSRKVSTTLGTIALEFGSDDDIGRLERVWDKIQGKHGDVIGSMQPYFSVDAKAENGGKESFHLRVGPVKTVAEGESLCEQLGRRGVQCSVVRTE